MRNRKAGSPRNNQAMPQAWTALGIRAIGVLRSSELPDQLQAQADRRRHDQNQRKETKNMKAQNYEARANRILDWFLDVAEASGPNYKLPDLKLRRGLIEELPAILNWARQEGIKIDPNIPMFSNPLTEAQMKYVENVISMTESEEKEERAAALSKVLWALYQSACHRQIGPNGKVCAVCGDRGHQGFACPFNAFVRFDALRRTARELYAEQT